jgi:hypothetical protein
VDSARCRSPHWQASLSCESRTTSKGFVGSFGGGDASPPAPPAPPPPASQAMWEPVVMRSWRSHLENTVYKTLTDVSGGDISRDLDPQSGDKAPLSPRWICRRAAFQDAGRGPRSLNTTRAVRRWDLVCASIRSSRAQDPPQNSVNRQQPHKLISRTPDPTAKINFDAARSRLVETERQDGTSPHLTLRTVWTMFRPAAQHLKRW